MKEFFSENKNFFLGRMVRYFSKYEEFLKKTNSQQEIKQILNLRHFLKDKNPKKKVT